jgi:CDP-6-deoxy-D-xylo-4-hexulose-3-dehydrase
MIKKFKYPLLSDAFSKSDINCGLKVLSSKHITMSKITRNFEKQFAKKLGCKYALMTNSGSSANLLAVSAIINPLFKNKLKPGDEVLIPAVCWSTSLWPIIQNNLKPVFVDVELDTFNVSIKDLKKKITSKTKAFMCIHVLGTSANLSQIKKLTNKKNIILIEDTCESLGAKFNNKFLGTFGELGTFSFYYSHQITSGEGGMIVCNNLNNYNIIKSLRSHGWSRETTFHNAYKKKFKKLDDRFLFINSGYNLRPTDIQAAIAHNQFKRLNKFITIRNYNRKKIIEKVKNNKKWNNQFYFINHSKMIKPSWFGLPILIKNKFLNKKKKFLDQLTKCGVENRPILSGNFTNQPATKLYNLNSKKLVFANAQKVENLGFFIGLHTKKISNEIAEYISESLLNIDKM